MEKMIYTAILMLLSVMTVSADDLTGRTTVRSYDPDETSITGTDGRIGVRGLDVTRNGDRLDVRFTLDLSRVKVKSEQREVITPVLVNGDSSMVLYGAIVTGRSRHIRDLREGFSPEGYTMFRSGRADSLVVAGSLPLQDWMLDARLTLSDTLTGCNCRQIDAGDRLLATLDLRPRIFAPVYEYIAEVADVDAEKVRHADGHAYIDFPVNKTEIYPDYRRNPVELAAIRDTIELIKNDSDYNITALTLKGYASPEGSYSGNELLAKGRTEALREYIRKLYAFPAPILHSEWEAEDWQGLISYLRGCDLPDREAMLEIVTTPVYDGNPDGREWKLKSTYPQQYKILLAEVYPGLRHTDYTIRYTVKSYTTMEELRRAWAENPGKLSVAEIFKLASAVEPGTPEYVGIFETAARIYPDSPEVNLNAGVSALRNDELDRAGRYLDRAGESSQAAYARGILAARRGDFDGASAMFRKAAGKGSHNAEDALGQIAEIMKHR